MTSDRKSAKYLLAALPQGDSFMDIVEHYLKNNLPIFPVNNLKMPAIKKPDTWKRKFSLNEFERYTAVAIRLGELIPGFGYLVNIDFDHKSYAMFIRFMNSLREHGFDSNTVTVKTGGNHDGYHLYFLMNEQPPRTAKRCFRAESEEAAIEFRGSGCYCVIPPSKPNCIRHPYKITGTELPPRILNPYERIDRPGTAFVLEDCKGITLIQWRSVLQQMTPFSDKRRALKKSTALPPLSENSNNTGTIGFKGVVTVEEGLPERKDDKRRPTPRPHFQGVVTHNSESITGSREGQKLWNDPLLWDRVLFLLYKDVYGEEEASFSENLRWWMGFKCVIHPEHNRSAQLIVSSKSGDIVYMDYHGKYSFKDGKGDNRTKTVYLLPEVYLHCRRARGELSESIGKGEAWKLMVQEANFWTPQSICLKEFWTQIRPKVEDFFFPAVIRVADVMMAQAILEARTGKDTFLASVRFVEIRAKTGRLSTCNAINLLNALGLIIKGAEKRISGNRSTPLFKVNINAEHGLIRKLFYSCVDCGMTSIERFTRQIEEKVFGKHDRRRQSDAKEASVRCATIAA